MRFAQACGSRTDGKPKVSETLETKNKFRLRLPGIFESFRLYSNALKPSGNKPASNKATSLRYSAELRTQLSKPLLASAIFAAVSSITSSVGHAQITFLNSFGSAGTGNGQFSFPAGMAVGSNGTLYVADFDNSRVETFSASGAFQSVLGTSGQFDTPTAVAVGPTGSVYVADYGNNHVEIFGSSGIFQNGFGSGGPHNAQFNLPYGIAVGPDGTVYVADNGNNRVETFSSSGVFQSTFGSQGTGNGQFEYPDEVATGPTGMVYVTDTQNNRVEIFSPSGVFQSAFGAVGSGNGQFNSPDAVAVSPGGTVYVVDQSNNRVEVFSSSGVFQSAFGSFGTGNGQFNVPSGIAVGPTGMVYVAEGYNNRVQRFFNPSEWTAGTNVFTDPTAGLTSITLGVTSGTFTIGLGMGLIVGGTLSVGQAASLVQSGGSITTGNLLLNSNSFTYQSGPHSLGAITLAAGSSFSGAAFTLASSESISIAGNGATISSSALTVASGSAVTQSNGTLSSPVINIAGTYTYSGGSFTPSAAFVQAGGELTQTSLSNTTVIDLLSGGLLAGSAFTNTTSGQLTGAGVVTTDVVNQGSIVANGGVLKFTGAFANAGSLIVGGGSEALFNNFPLNAATISLNGGTFSTNAATFTNTGQLLGYGVVQTGGLTNSGTLAFGGQSSVYGSLTNTSAALVHLSGSAPNVFYSAFTSSGTLSIDTGAVGIIYGAYSGSGKIVDYGSLYLNASSVAGPISGNGNLTIGNSSSGPAVVQLAAGSGASTLASLVISAGSTLDINNNRLIIDYGRGPDPIASIATWITSGYAAGAWNGPGIISSAAQSNSFSYGIGFADSADLGNPAGLASGTIEIKYTLLGDANLDGKVNGADFAILAANFNKSVSGASGWDQGDFNGADFAFLAANFNKGASQSAADLAVLESFAQTNGLSAAVPEPSTFVVLALSAASLTPRRRPRARLRKGDRTTRA